MKDKEEKKNKNYRVIFINTYIGDLGIIIKEKFMSCLMIYMKS
jgi:hypothetical protein